MGLDMSDTHMRIVVWGCKKGLGVLRGSYHIVQKKLDGISNSFSYICYLSVIFKSEIQELCQVKQSCIR